MKNTAEALQYFADCVDNHQDCGQFYNYEDFAREGFKLRGHGFVYIDVSNWVKAYLSGSSLTWIQVDHKYVTLAQDTNTSDDLLPEELNTISEYDPETEYAILLVVHKAKPPKLEAAQIPKNLVFFATRLSYIRAVKPSRISRSQIRKRLKRMIEQGIKLLIFDTKQPDFMGANLGKWLYEIKELERKGNICQLSSILTRSLLPKFPRI